jgi:hypothetical protein
MTLVLNPQVQSMPKANRNEREKYNGKTSLSYDVQKDIQEGT